MQTIIHNRQTLHINRPPGSEVVFYFCILRPSPVEGSGPLNRRQSVGVSICKNTKIAAYATCGTVSIIELKAHIEHRAHSLHCCELCRASEHSCGNIGLSGRLWQQSIHWAAVTSQVYLHCKDCVNVGHMLACC